MQGFYNVISINIRYLIMLCKEQNEVIYTILINSQINQCLVDNRKQHKIIYIIISYHFYL